MSYGYIKSEELLLDELSEALSYFPPLCKIYCDLSLPVHCASVSHICKNPH